MEIVNSLTHSPLLLTYMMMLVALGVFNLWLNSKRGKKWLSGS